MGNIYEERGYRDREDYLRSLAEDYALPLESVKEIAELLGPEEDFDGLICTLQDAEDFLSA